MATAEEIRQRLAELNRDTAARTGPNPASESMRARMAAANRVVARDLSQNPASDSLRARMASLDRDTARTLRGAPTAPAGTRFTSPNAASFSGTSAAPAPASAAPGRAPGAVRSFLGRSVNTPTTRALGRIGGAARGVGGFALRSATGPLAALTTAATVGNAFSNTEMGERVRQPFTDLLARLTGLDEQQNQMLSDDPEISGAAVDAFRASQPPPVPAPADNPVVPLSGRTDAVDSGVPVNSIRTADGRVLPVDPDAQVNSMSAENFTRIGSGLSQRLGDARLAAAERGDFGQLATDREAFQGQLDTNREIVANYDREQAEALLRRSGGVTGRRLAPVSDRENSVTRNAMATLGRLNADADRSAQLEATRIDADARRQPAENPLMSPSVIAERLRQEGQDRRATGPDLFRGLEPIEDVTGNVTGFQGLNSQGIPVIIPQGELQILASQFQQMREGGVVPPGESFADWVSRIKAETGQG